MMQLEQSSSPSAVPPGAPLTDPARLSVLRSNVVDVHVFPGLDRLTRLAARFVAAPTAIASLADHGHHHVASYVSTADTPRAFPESICRFVASSGVPLIIEDTRRDPLGAAEIAAHGERVIAYAGVPLRASNGRIIGTLSVVDGVPRHWSDREIDALADLAESVVREIELVIELQEADDERGDRVMSVIEQLAKRAMQPRFVDVALVVEAVKADIVETAGAAIEVVTSHGLSAGVVLMDPEQLRLVLLNLASNARDAMPDGGTLRVETRNVSVNDAHGGPGGTLTVGPHVELRVSDSGCGIPLASIARVFDPFYTTKSADRGTGLGLSTVYGIIRQTGGDVSVTSAVGAGTTVRIVLPCID